jgi:predicted O-linked N-acetylglucosamine transferase (SPINDLY family)
MPTLSEAFAIAQGHHQAGRIELAEEIYRRLLAADPEHADALHRLGVLLCQRGELAGGIDLIRRAIARKPAAEYYNHLGMALRAQGNLAEATASYRRAAELRPDFAEAHNNLGNALRVQGDPAGAVLCFQRALQLRPNLAEAHSNLGVAFQQLGQFAEAVACYRRAIELNPTMFLAHSNLGLALLRRGALAEAMTCFQHAVQLQPECADAQLNLGAALQAQGRVAEAMACYRRALQAKPDYVEAYGNLGNAAQQVGQLDEALACYRHALQLRPDSADLHNNLGNAWKDAGCQAEALASYRQAVALRPDFAEAHSNLVYALHFCADNDARTIYAAHREWAQRHAQPLACFCRPHGNDRSPERRLRLGYVSPDLREHPVGRFLLPLLEAHDHRQFEIYCYTSTMSPDAVTTRLQAAADVWREVWTLSDEQLAAQIRQDGIDVLVDLSMHMGGNRMRCFARQPAPVQVTYLAYCGTTGLDTIDYRLTDPYLDPPGSEEGIYAERSVWLPESYWCYQAPASAPPVARLPALERGGVTFGALNNFAKVTTPTLAAWRRLLHAVPQSRLFLHAPAGRHRDRVCEQLGLSGSAVERVEFAKRSRLADYLAVYQHIDVALDPFPYGGGTTTCDALWMGVPVVSLAGQTAVGRGGLSILSNVGLPELVARDADHYVRIAADLAADLTHLSELRATLRERMQRSPLMDAPRFARNVESAYRTMWRRWCAAGETR